MSYKSDAGPTRTHLMSITIDTFPCTRVTSSSIETVISVQTIHKSYIVQIPTLPTAVVDTSEETLTGIVLVAAHTDTYHHSGLCREQNGALLIYNYNRCNSWLALDAGF